MFDTRIKPGEVSINFLEEITLHKFKEKNFEPEPGFELGPPDLKYGGPSSNPGSGSKFFS